MESIKKLALNEDSLYSVQTWQLTTGKYLLNSLFYCCAYTNLLLIGKVMVEDRVNCQGWMNVTIAPLVHFLGIKDICDLQKSLGKCIFTFYRCLQSFYFVKTMEDKDISLMNIGKVCLLTSIA